MEQRLDVSADTTYIIKHDLIQGKIHALQLTYEHRGKRALRSLVTYRITKESAVERYKQMMVDMIDENGKELCLSKLTNWKWVYRNHPILFCIRHRN